jgi:hypothetical protein
MYIKGRPIPWQRQRIWPALFLVLLSVCVLTPIVLSKTQPKADDLPTMIESLKREAILAREQGKPPAQADAASRTAATVDVLDISRAMTQQLDRDPFIDAYIRWQLTSYDPPLALPERAYQPLLASLPTMVENPRAGSDTMDLLARAAAAGPLSPSDFQQLQEFSAALDAQSEQAEHMNRPAIELRRWLHDAADPTTVLPMLLLVEECAATIDAGWSTRSIKTRISRACRTYGEDDELATASKRLIARSLQRLEGMERRSINQITFMADRSVNVNYTTAAVTPRDVENWTTLLAGQ